MELCAHGSVSDVLRWPLEAKQRLTPSRRQLQGPLRESEIRIVTREARVAVLVRFGALSHTSVAQAVAAKDAAAIHVPSMSAEAPTKRH